MRKVIQQVAALAISAVVVVTSGCGAVGSLVANKVSEATGIGGKGTTVSALWSDVPPIEGATKSTADMPLTVKLAAQAFMNAAGGFSPDYKVDGFDFIAFTTPKKPDDVFQFYSSQRMESAGWPAKSGPGCLGSNGATTSGATLPAGVGLCLFGKPGAVKGQGTVLIISATQDDTAKFTNVFYMRFSGTDLTVK